MRWQILQLTGIGSPWRLHAGLCSVEDTTPRGKLIHRQTRQVALQYLDVSSSLPEVGGVKAHCEIPSVLPCVEALL